MKLRIKDNTIRLRLSQVEVSSLANNGIVSCVLDFGNNALKYQLIKKGDQVDVQFDDHTITVSAPADTVDSWASSSQVGFSTAIELAKGKALHILVEKDFKCLTDRPHEDESDLFENPLDNHNC